MALYRMSPCGPRISVKPILCGGQLIVDLAGYPHWERIVS